jgi:uncharacterized protein (TIGR02145 family)
VAAGEWKAFKCHNLGADESADPFTASWKLNGDYYQWGRATVAANGPTGPDSLNANNGSITGWSTTAAANGAWVDSIKTANDPCPAGFRVPTKAQWEAVINSSLNPTVSYGTGWSTTMNAHTNYAAGLRIGSGTSGLFLPAAGTRSNTNGSLSNRNVLGYYWSSTEVNSDAGYLYFRQAGGLIQQPIATGSIVRTRGFSVRCIAE